LEAVTIGLGPDAANPRSTGFERVRTPRIKPTSEATSSSVSVDVVLAVFEATVRRLGQ
jgi:hypothetical protein